MVLTFPGVQMNSQGVDGLVPRTVTPVAFADANGNYYKVEHNKYARAVRNDGQCTEEVVISIQDKTSGKVRAEGYETLDQAMKVLNAMPGEQVKISIFGANTIRTGHGVGSGMIVRAQNLGDLSAILKTDVNPRTAVVTGNVPSGTDTRPEHPVYTEPVPEITNTPIYRDPVPERTETRQPLNRDDPEYPVNPNPEPERATYTEPETGVILNPAPKHWSPNS